MLITLLKVHLKPYQGAVVAVIVLQLVQTIATLFLPTLNARIIDDGVAKGDTTEILRLGGVMLGVSLVQVLAAVVAVYFGARTAMAFGRDVRKRLFDVTGGEVLIDGVDVRALSPDPVSYTHLTLPTN